MTFWAPETLASLADGDWLADPPSDHGEVTGVGIDTRTLAAGHLYLAIRGENHDGHDFVEAALAQGAAFAVVEDAQRFSGSDSDLPGPVLAVDSCVDALRDWAIAYRDVLTAGGCTVIAVAGSNGKTTTRHLIHHVLTSGGKTGTQSPKSFNNHLGVPLTLLAARPDHDFVACEVGTNHPGEIAALSEIVRPEVAVITSIGAEHLEFFGDLDGVAKEEAALLPFVKPNGAVVLHPEDAERIAPHYDVQEGVVVAPFNARHFEGIGFSRLAIPGEHNRRNAKLAAALGRWFGLTDDRIEAALSSATAPEGRMQIIRYAGNDAESAVTVIHDAYNANPDSFPHALFALSEANGRKLAVLADMLELGDHAAAAHARVQQEAERVADRCWFVGEHFAGAEPWSDELATDIVNAVEPGDTVLLKGSRAWRLERILPAIEARFGPAQD